MPGGLQIQARKTYQAINAAGTDFQAELFAWSERDPLPDLYHFMGFPPHQHAIANLIKTAKVPYVVTILFGCPDNQLAMRMASLRHRMKVAWLRLAGKRQTVAGASRCITITELDLQAATRTLHFPPERVHLVPNGVDETFFHAAANGWQELHARDPFILCTGAVQKRKNQLLLAQAANEAQLPLVLLGPILPGEENYGVLVHQAMQANKRWGGHWLTNLPCESPLLVSAYAACRFVALLSNVETQPLSVMEAMAVGKPVLLRSAPYRNSEPFKQLPHTAAQTPTEIASVLRQVWETGIPTSLPSIYRWHHVAEKLTAIYRSVLKEKPTPEEVTPCRSIG